MTSTLPGRGKGQEKESSQPKQSSAPAKRSRSRSQGAMNDAQQSLHSLLNPQADDTQPHIISPSGATRNQTRGRVAAPAPNSTNGNGRSPKPQSPGSGLLIEGGNQSASSDPLLAIVPGTKPLYDDNDIHDIPQTRIQVGLARANEQMQAVRDRATLLLGTSDDAASLGLDEAALHTSRRAAARWVTRYATHIVVLMVVVALVAFGGLKSMTVAGANPNGLQSVEAYEGTDHFGNDTNGPGIDSQDYEMTLPRTELGGTDAAANSRIVQPEAGQPVDGTEQNSVPDAAAVRTTVTAYTVAQGDTIQSVADKFQVLPETIMGSNGIYDGDESLVAGRVLNIPPIDGMYYVPKANDTLDTIARRFQVDPSVIAAYEPNNMADGVVKPGQPIIVPGGMIPQRETVITYVVKPGDTLKGIAARYGVDVPTMIRSNNIPNPDALQIGSELRVLPIAGMEYTVQKGDSIISIAQKLDVSTQNILDYSPNGLTVDSTLQPGQVIVVPGGSPEQPQVVASARIEPSSRGSSSPVNTKPAASTKPQTQPVTKPAAAQPAAAKPAAPKPDTSYKGGTGRMVWPVNGRITQYFSSAHNGLDIAIAAGTPIHAADSGKVIWSGWRTDGLGYCVFIDHLNGLLTVYGHMIRQPAVYVGQYVSRGQVIGYIGSTGHSTGPHVHFMVKVGTGRNYRNPLAYLGGR